MIKTYSLPLSEDEILSLKCGEIIEISGVIYTARDAAHKRITESLTKSCPLPFELKNAAIYYTGPTPARKGEIIGSCGPTTSARMDDYTPQLLDSGLKIMIGKGGRNNDVISSIKKNRALYLVAIGGAAAIIKDNIKSCEVVAFEDLGCEAVHRLEVKNMRLAVAIDSYGNGIF